MSDGKPRCGWAGLSVPEYLEYHDKEWGVPVHSEHHLFEMLTLEGAQAGLSWLTVLRKRDEYRKVFAQFDASKVARFSEKKVQSLLKNPGIIRNRLKINSTVDNAKVFLRVQKEFNSFDAYIWEFVNNTPIVTSPKSMKELPARTEISDRLSKDLQKRGFRFVGSTIMYAFMQAIGMTNDHEVGCFRYRELTGQK